MDIKSSIALSSHVATAGIGLAITGTRFGLGIARAVTGGLATVAGAVIDQTLSLSTPQTPLTGGPASLLLSSLTSSSWDVVDYLAITPLILSQSITATSLNAAASLAHSVIGSSAESDFSLGAFVSLVQREVLDENQRSTLPEKLDYSFMSVLKALGAWAALQSVTSKYSDEKTLEGMREINVERTWGGLNQEPLEGERRPTASGKAPHFDEDIHITNTEEIHSDGILDSTVISAQIGHPSSRSPPLASSLSDAEPASTFATDILRYANICLGSYGGAGMLFFGIPIPKKAGNTTSASTSTAAAAAEEELVVTVERVTPEEAVDEKMELEEVEAEVEKDAQMKEKKPKKEAGAGFFKTVFGKHDQDIFEHFADLKPDASSTSTLPSSSSPLSTAALEAHGGLPRFWILTDHNRRTVVLCIRGTMSLNELAIDLACDASDFVPHTTTPSSGKPKVYHVHSGMLLLARKMGDEGGKVAMAVRRALEANEGYGLVLTGHSLGAGVAALLGLLWADLDTCETSAVSGLPVGRRMKVWAFACPCITSSSLSNLSRPLITSIELSYDLVSRLSLGSIRDLRAVSDWLSFALKDGSESGTDGLLGRIARYKLGGKGRWIDLDARKEEEDYFLSLRKTLSAQMQSTHLFPAGTTYLLLDPTTDLHEGTRPHLLPLPTSNEEGGRTTRVFEVLKPEVVFREIVFDGRMLSCHLPQKYAAALKGLF